jgi:cysteine synthase B
MNLIETIGNTPLVEINNLRPRNGVRVLAKLEGNNPAGSVKDRIAYYMIREAEKSGALTEDRVILEPTSGNTGIGLAMIASAKGYKVKLVMPACVSEERKNILRAFGADLILTPGEQRVDGAILKAREILAEDTERYFMPDQFNNANNVLAHYETTGPEILRQTDGELDVFVAGMGTTGTLMGVGRRLKEHHPAIRIVGVEPTLGHSIQGLKNMSESILPSIYQPELLDEKITVTDEEAYHLARRLAREEGIFVGMSSGAALSGALKIAEKMRRGTIVVIFPDRGDRYLSTTMFRSTCARCPP